eukprot:636822-Pelagomonas_calceolata.AAC.1
MPNYDVPELPERQNEWTQRQTHKNRSKACRDNRANHPFFQTSSRLSEEEKLQQPVARKFPPAFPTTILSRSALCSSMCTFEQLLLCLALLGCHFVCTLALALGRAARCSQCAWGLLLEHSNAVQCIVARLSFNGSRGNASHIQVLGPFCKCSASQSKAPE